jgi:hypothetical protein
MLQETFCFGGVLLRRRFVTEAFCYGDVLSRRRFVRRRFVCAPFNRSIFCLFVCSSLFSGENVLREKHASERNV